MFYRRRRRGGGLKLVEAIIDPDNINIDIINNQQWNGYSIYLKQTNGTIMPLNIKGNCSYYDFTSTNFAQILIDEFDTYNVDTQTWIMIRPFKLVDNVRTYCSDDIILKLNVDTNASWNLMSAQDINSYIKNFCSDNGIIQGYIDWYIISTSDYDYNAFIGRSTTAEIIDFLNIKIYPQSTVEVNGTTKTKYGGTTNLETGNHTKNIMDYIFLFQKRNHLLLSSDSNNSYTIDYQDNHQSLPDTTNITINFYNENKN